MEKKVSGLVITGNAFIHKYLSAILERAGVSAICLDCGKKALSMRGRDRFDLVFINEYLPDMSPLDLHGELKAKWPRATYIMLLTGKRSIEKMLDKYGVDAALVKPLKTEDVLAVVDGALALSLKNSYDWNPAQPL